MRGSQIRPFQTSLQCVHPPGKLCDSRIPYEVFHLQSKCSLCHRIATNRLRQQQEWDRIEGLESKEQVDDKGVQRSIGIINQQQHEILVLELERRGRRITAPDGGLENIGSPSLGSAVESEDLITASTAYIVAAGKFRFQLKALIVRYHVLDTISLMKAEVIQSRMNSIFAEPPTRITAGDFGINSYNDPQTLVGDTQNDTRSTYQRTTRHTQHPVGCLAVHEQYYTSETERVCTDGWRT